MWIEVDPDPPSKYSTGLKRLIQRRRKKNSKHTECMKCTSLWPNHTGHRRTTKQLWILAIPVRERETSHQRHSGKVSEYPRSCFLNRQTWRPVIVHKEFFFFLIEKMDTMDTFPGGLFMPYVLVDALFLYSQCLLLLSFFFQRYLDAMPTLLEWKTSWCSAAKWLVYKISTGGW